MNVKLHTRWFEARRLGLVTAALLMTVTAVALAKPEPATAATPVVGGGQWDLQASVTVTGAPSRCSFRRVIGDSVIRVKQSRSGRLSASERDNRGKWFRLRGSAKNRSVRFTISGPGITPGSGGCSLAGKRFNTTFTGKVNPFLGTITGSARGFARLAFRKDEDKNLVFQTVRWRGSFTVKIRNQLTRANSIMASSLPTFLGLHARGAGAFDWDTNGRCDAPDWSVEVFGHADRPFGFDFLDACLRHDFGYANFGKDSWLKLDASNRRRLAIDEVFLADMRRLCASQTVAGSARGGLCRTTARLYYEGVRAGGGAFF
jgi:hypothetical protein